MSLCFLSGKSSVWAVLAMAAGLALAANVAATETLYLTIARTNSNVWISWTNSGAALESALVLTGSWSEVTGAVSPVVVSPTNVSRFLRLRGTLTPSGFDFRYLAPTFTTSIGDPFGCGCTSPENPNSLVAGGSAQDNGGGAVLLHTGELTQEAVDLEIPGRGINWRFERRYRSGMSYDGPVGQGWDFNYNQRLVAEAGGNMLRVNGLGRVDRYTLNTNGTFNSPSGLYTRLKRNLDGTFEERDRYGSTNVYSSTNTLGVARLTRISDRNGNQMTFQYNSAGQLTNVTDTLARSIAYRYDGNGRLTNVTDFAGRALRFAYDGNGDLLSAASPSVNGTPTGNDFPSGKTTAYSYASGFGDGRFNHNLLSVTAPNEVAAGGPARLVAQYDANPASSNADRLVSLRLGGTNGSGAGAGGTITYGYVSPGPAGSNDFASPVFENTVTNRNGNRSEYRFNQLGNIVRVIQFTRGLRPSEPPGYTNTFAYSRDGEMTGRTNGELDTVDYTFDSANTDRLQQGNLLEARRLPGPRGGAQAQILTSQTYETNFNFATTSTDGRGNMTLHRYDARGNRTNTVHRIPSIVEDFEYNAFGQRTALVLPANGSAHRRRDTMTYYSSGPQTGYLQAVVVDSGGFNLTTTYEYDSIGNLVRMVDPRGNDTLYTVNALNQVVRESSRAVSTISGPVRYERDTIYDANNNVVRAEVQNRDGTGAVVGGNPAFTATYGYDILDRSLVVTQEVDTVTNIVTAYGYDPNQNRVLTRFGEATAGHDPLNLVQVLYDERDLRFEEIRGPGSAGHSTTQMDYDANANLVRTFQGLESTPRLTVYAYDGYDRRTTTTDAMGNVLTVRYDANGNAVTNRAAGELNDVPGSAGNVRLSETSYQYDAMDRRVRSDTAFFDTQTQLPIGDGFASTQFGYADNSQVTNRNQDTPGHVTTYSYDTVNRLLRVTDARSNTTTYAYDSNNNRTNVAELDKSDLGKADELFKTTYSYDSMDRLIRQVDNAGNTQQYAYDSRNNRVLNTDARTNQTRYVYDGLNRLVQTARDMNTNGVFGDPVDIITTQTWDDSSRLTGQTDDNTNTTRYSYDSLNRRIATDYADCTTNSTTYDVRDNVITTTDANGTQVSRSYDQNNRLTNQVVTSFGSGVSPDTTFENYQYDGLSRLIRAEDNDSVVTRAYDSLGNLSTETEQVAGGPVRTITGTYDGERNQTRLVYPGGRAIVRSYEILDRPLVVNEDPPSGSSIATHAYIGPYRLEQRDYPKPNPAQTTRFTPSYDGLRRTTNTAHSLVGGATFDQRHYDWDGNHNKVHANRSLPAPAEDRTYSYDAANRLIQSLTKSGATILTSTTYGLDGAGNRTNVSGGSEPGTYTMNPVLCNPGDFQMSQYTASAPTNTAPLFSEPFSYPDGNLAGNATWSAHSATGLVAVQVVGGKARLSQGAGGREDVNALLGTTMGAGQKFYAAFDLVNTGGNGTVYFAHFKDSGTFNFAARVFITTNGLGDYTVGLSGGSPTVGATWPAGLTFGTTYRIVTSCEFDTGNVQLWVNPASFASASIIATGFTNTVVSSYALRQATPSSGTSTQTVDNLCVSDSFSNALNCSGTPAPTYRQYDAKGNLLSTSVPQSLVYDYRNRLVQFIGGGQSASYRYDCFGRRIEKNVSGSVTRFYYDGAEEIEEQDIANTTLATYVHSKGVANLLEMTRSGQQFYFHEDNSGDIVKVSNTNGALVDLTEYGDYGKPFFPAGPQTGNLFSIYDSDQDPNTNGIAYELADDFWFPASAQVTNLIWRGGYDYTTNIPSQDFFVIRAYAANGSNGLPGALIYSNSLSPSQVIRTPTGRSVCCAAIGQSPEFEYQLTSVSPISVPGNTRLWLSIVNNTTGTSSTWGLESSRDGNARSALRTSGTNAWLVASGDLTFKLVTTQTASGNPFLYRACRFDAESGFILAGRYLDPVTGRFLTRLASNLWADERNLGNAVAYAGNNPFSVDTPFGCQQKDAPNSTNNPSSQEPPGNLTDKDKAAIDKAFEDLGDDDPGKRESASYELKRRLKSEAARYESDSHPQTDYIRKRTEETQDPEVQMWGSSAIRYYEQAVKEYAQAWKPAPAVPTIEVVTGPEMEAKKKEAEKEAELKAMDEKVKKGLREPSKEEREAEREALRTGNPGK